MEKEPLHDLIRSLNKSEKRYFKLYCSIQQKEGEEMNYLRLFEFLEAQEVYNEEEVMEKFKGETFIQQLHVTKNYLYNLILRALRGFFHEALPELDASNQLQNFEILYSKGLFRQCLKVLNKVEKMAAEKEDHIRLMHIYRLRLHLLQRHDNEKTYDKVMEYWNALNNEAERHFNFIKIRKHAIAMYHVIAENGIRRNESARKKIDQLLKSLKDSNINEENLSERSKYNLLNIDLAYYAFKGDGKKEIKTLEKMRDSLFEREGSIVSKPQMYIYSLSNLALAYSRSGHYEKARKCFDAIRSIFTDHKVKRTREVETIMFTDSSNTLFEFLNPQGGKSTAKDKEEVERLLSELDTYREYAVKLELLRLYFNIAYYFFLNGDHKRSNKYINIFFNEGKENQRNDLFIALSFMQLCIFYGNKELDLIAYALPRVKRKLQKLDSLNETEKQVLSWFGKMIDESSAKKQETHTDKLVTFLGKNSAPHAVWMESFDLLRWVSK
jgi:hypothetical protein